MSDRAADAALWSPAEFIDREPALVAFQRRVADKHGIDPHDYTALWEWSVDDVPAFWREVWEWFVIGDLGENDTVLEFGEMPEAVSWFPGVRLNFADFLLSQGSKDQEAVVGVSESGERRSMTRGDLIDCSYSFATALLDLGVGEGDRVVGYVPNIPEAIAAFLGAAAIGAVWSGVGQEYSPAAVVDRFSQLDPKILVVADGHHWNGAVVDRLESAAEIRRGLPTVEHVVVIDNVHLGRTDGMLDWADIIDSDASEFRASSLAFDHPLWVLYSSGTTGLPKGLVHGHGGILVELLKTLSLHFDIGSDDRFFWYSSPSWVMWNIQVCALATGAGIICYDGAPVAPTPARLWEIAADERATFVGLSPGYLIASENAGITPRDTFDLSALRAMGSTGSPLSPHAHRWAARAVGDIALWSVSGGTDIGSAFIGGAPTLPIWAGELSAPCLGVALQAWDDAGRSVREQVGELVITKPMPSMPLRLLNDPGHVRYRDAYFSTYPGTWRQGDWITVTTRGSVIIHGRSDSTINRNGIRMGSADIYAAVESLPEVVDSLVIGAEQDDGSYWMPLFVELAAGHHLSPELEATIRRVIRERASPRHVPDDVIEVRGIPRTKTGKKLEVPIKRILQGASVEAVVKPETLDLPALLSEYAAIYLQRHSRRSRPTQENVV